MGYPTAFREWTVEIVAPVCIFSLRYIWFTALFFPPDLKKKKEGERKKRTPCKDTINL